MMRRLIQDREIPTGSEPPRRFPDALFRSETPGLLRYFRRWRDGQDEPADLVQEVFVRAASASGFHTSARPEAYLQRIARNLLFERSRNERRHAHLRVSMGEADEARTSPEQEDTVAFSQMMRIYEDALGGLTERTRQVYLMHRVDEMSYKAIAEKLAISQSGVEKHMMKAIAHIDRVVAPWR
jgi:RNA polymerase sigma factor (sigma-70 family)